jgi:hypothetical protein
MSIYLPLEFLHRVIIVLQLLLLGDLKKQVILRTWLLDLWGLAVT